MESPNYTAQDLLWVKNVKRDNGNTWAYTEHNIGQPFYLNWPRGRANMGHTNAALPAINQLILIFQTVNKKSGYDPGTYLTHIVTPISKDVVTDNSSTHPFKRLVSVIAKSTHPIPKPLFLNFHKPNRRWVCTIDLIEATNKTRLSINNKQIIIWDLFIEKDATLKRSIIQSILLGDEEQINEPIEGVEKFVIGQHKYYERNPKVIKMKKEWAKLRNLLYCEVCSLDFSIFYGIHGHGFIECHHNVHISSGVRTTKPEDLALVCSNCHSMLHRRNQEGNYYDIKELKSLLENVNI